ncbi:MAG TPA: hypothetical protein VFS15_01740 [Kofleriaceae bacterium]|nr:hypothetical protein [Kofleriaceae bacterium]
MDGGERCRGCSDVGEELGTRLVFGLGVVVIEHVCEGAARIVDERQAVVDPDDDVAADRLHLAAAHHSMFARRGHGGRD